MTRRLDRADRFETSIKTRLGAAFDAWSAGFQDTVAPRLKALGIDNVGRTDATRELAASLETLQSDFASAKGEADKLDEELATHLMRAGPLTPEQQAELRAAVVQHLKKSRHS